MHLTATNRRGVRNLIYIGTTTYYLYIIQYLDVSNWVYMSKFQVFQWYFYSPAHTMFMGCVRIMHCWKYFFSFLDLIQVQGIVLRVRNGCQSFDTTLVTDVKLYQLFLFCIWQNTSLSDFYSMKVLRRRCFWVPHCHWCDGGCFLSVFKYFHYLKVHRRDNISCARHLNDTSGTTLCHDLLSV